MASGLVKQKIGEIIMELKQQHLWKQERPQWVNDFGGRENKCFGDFTEWLQFIFLPNLLQNGSDSAGEKKFVAPQAMRFLGEDVKRGELLRLLIELDSLT
ncbi:MAG TPA: YqcC family protein [Chitinophagaceae bacterium]|jgi:uncharacterized protein YqcC (DUF446 family)|nr:YqcC family protein [Chitinophagaceae bacterium]